MFRLKVACRGHAHSCQRKSPTPGPLWQRWIKSPHKLELAQWFCWLFAPSATGTWHNSELNKRCVWAMYINQAAVVQKIDNAIHWINHLPLDSTIGFPNPYWIVIYPVDSTIQLLNNWGQMWTFCILGRRFCPDFWVSHLYKSKQT